MINKWYLRKGIAFQSTADIIDNGFDLLKWLKKTLKYLNNGGYDICCPTAIDATATASTDSINQGYITSASTATTTITLPTATSFASKKGVIKTFTVDNTGGANTVTVAVGTGITTGGVMTGFNTLTVASGTAGQFVLFFKSGTTAQLTRVF